MYNLNGENVNNETTNENANNAGAYAGNFSNTEMPNTGSPNNDIPNAGMPNTGASFNGGSYSSMPDMNGQPPKKSGIFGILALIFSIIAFPVAWFIPLLGLMFGIAGLVLAIIGCGKGRASHALAVTGLVLSILALIFTIVIWAYRVVSILNTVSDTSPNIEDILDEPSNDILDDSDDVLGDYSDDTDKEDSIVDIEDTVIFSEAGITVTATDIVYQVGYDGLMEPKLNVLIENTTTQTVSPVVDYCAVNNVSISTDIYEDISAGKKANSAIEFDSEEFALAGFTEIEDLQIQMNFQNDSYDYITSNAVVVEYSFSDSYVPFDVSQLSTAVPVSSNADINIYYAGTTQKWDDTLAFVFYVENKSDKFVTVDVSDLSVNEFMKDTYASSDTAGGNGSFLLVSPSDEELKEADITSASASFAIFDGDYNLLFETGDLAFVGTK